MEVIKDFFNSPEMSREKWLRKGRTFHTEDIKFLKEIIPEKSNILELGCGNGHLLASLNPKYGLGIDFSKKFIKEAQRLNVIPLSTCFASQHVRELKELGFEEIKIASYDCASFSMRRIQ